MAASVTPPLAPNILPAPDVFPNNESYSLSWSFARFMPFDLKSFAYSLTVRTASTSRPPSVYISGLSASCFLAVQGITAMWYILSFPR